MKVVIYARVSTKEQVDGYSLEAQIELCRKWASEQGHEVVHVFIEHGKSARTDKRPAFQSAIAFVRAGGADAVLVHKSDRFARNLLDFLTYQDLLENKKKRILSASEEFLNDNSHASRFVSRIIGATAEYISDNIGRESQKGRDQKARTGAWPGGKPPYGYCRDKNKAIITDKYAANVMTAFREFATGRYTLQTWADKAWEMNIANSKGDKIRATTWNDIFRNVFYTGRFVWKGEEFVGDHAAIIDSSVFERVGEILSERNSGGTANRHFWLLNGLLWSAAENQAMRGSIAKGQYCYYRATEHHVRAEFLESKVMELLAKCVGYNHAAPEILRIALKVAPNLASIYEFLPSLAAKKEFLNMIFMENGLTVSWGGAIVDAKLRVGFSFI